MGHRRKGNLRKVLLIRRFEGYGQNDCEAFEISQWVWNPCDVSE